MEMIEDDQTRSVKSYRENMEINNDDENNNQ